MVNDANHTPRQRRVRHNDYAVLDVPDLEGWVPSKSVSVVVPAFASQPKLDLLLAALAAQSYPGDLLDVVVVDDGTAPPLTLPRLAPPHVRIVRAPSNRWGSAHAVHTGVSAAEADVILRLDADVIVHRHHVAAHMRWHHLADYLTVIGKVSFVEASGTLPSPEAVHYAVEEDGVSELLNARNALPSWADRVIADTNGLVEAGNRAFRVASGATISWTARMYRSAGGMNAELLLGSDTEFGYRLAQAGAVFVPEPAAEAWHLGMSQMKSRADEGRRYRLALLANYIPLQRAWRKGWGRQWSVPYVDVVVEAAESSYEDVRATVSGCLASDLPDVGVTVVGQWPTPIEEIADLLTKDRAVLDDPLLDLRLIQAEFGDDGRVSFVDYVPATSTPTPFRLVCPAGLVPAVDAIRRLVELADANRYGLVLLAFPRDSCLNIARLERTEAIARAAWLADPGENIVDVVHEIFGTHWIDGSEWALIPASDARSGHSPSQLQSEVDRLRRLAEELEQELVKRDADIELLRRAPATSHNRPALHQRALRTLRRALRAPNVRTPTGGSHS
jgi:GT2 family glycosyltransferase